MRSPETAHGPAQRGGFSRAALLVIAMAALSAGACSSDPGGSVRSAAGAGARLALAAEIHALEATAVDVRVYYQSRNVEVELTESVVQLPASSTQLEVPLSSCLGDGARVPLVADACPVIAELVLLRSGTELDRTIVGPVQVRNGETASFPTATLFEVATIDIALANGGAFSFEPETTVTLVAAPRDRTGAAVTGRVVSWTTANATIAAIAASTGQLTTVAPGTVVIGVSGGGRSGQVNFQVIPYAIRRVAITTSRDTLIAGAVVTFQATTFDRKDRALTGRAIAWSSDNTTIATVSAAGVVTAIAPGQATITASSEGVSARSVVAVIQAPVASVTMSLSNTSLSPGQTTTATAVARDALGNVLTGRAVSWSSTNNTVATVSSAGLVTAVSTGTADIIALIETVADTMSVTVVGFPGLITGLVKNASTSTVLVNAMVRLSGGALTRTATTLPSGVYQFQGVAPGTYLLEASLAGFQTTSSSSVVVASVTGGDVIRADFGLAQAGSTQPVGSVFGRVLSASGAPVPNAPVSLSGGAQTNGPFLSVASDANGNFTFAGVILIDASLQPIQGFTVSAFSQIQYGTRPVAISQNALSPNVIVTLDTPIPPAYFADSFELPSGWTSTGFWNRTTLAGTRNSANPNYVALAPNDLSLGALPAPPNGTFAYWFGQSGSGNYLGIQDSRDTLHSGGTSVQSYSGSLVSPQFAIPAGAPVATLSFQSWFEIESVNPNANGYDVMSVTVNSVPAGTTQTFRLNPSVDPPTTGENIPFTSGGVNAAPIWRLQAVDISAFIGRTVQLVFNFDTVDEAYNGFRGWIVDDVRISSLPAGSVSGARPMLPVTPDTSPRPSSIRMGRRSR